MELLTSSGILSYSREENQYRLVLEVDEEIARYYRSLIPKWLDAYKPRWAPHITIVRPEKEMPVNLEHWGKYEGEEVSFEYWNYLFTGKIYFWLNVWSKRLEDVRIELGMPVSSEFTRPPDGAKIGGIKCFHCTIANQKC